MSKHKEFHLAVKRVAGIKVAKCEDCGGSGRIPKPEKYKDIPDMPSDVPCVTCAPWRELEKLCWHDYTKRIDTRHSPSSWYICDTCKGYSRDGELPTYTIQSIRAVLESLGEWVDFENWIRKKITDTADIDIYGAFDILASDPLLLDAAIEYLKGVE